MTLEELCIKRKATRERLCRQRLHKAAQKDCIRKVTETSIVVDWFVKHCGMRVPMAGYMKKELCKALMPDIVGEFADDSESVDNANEEFNRYFPARVPDAFKIKTPQKTLTWLEVDDWHHTGSQKLEELAEVNDWLMDYEWGLKLIVIKIRPIFCMVTWDYLGLSPQGFWRFGRRTVKDVPYPIQANLMRFNGQLP